MLLAIQLPCCLHVVQHRLCSPRSPALCLCPPTFPRLWFAASRCPHQHSSLVARPASVNVHLQVSNISFPMVFAAAAPCESATPPLLPRRPVPPAVCGRLPPLLRRWFQPGEHPAGAHGQDGPQAGGRAGVSRHAPAGGQPSTNMQLGLRLCSLPAAAAAAVATDLCCCALVGHPQRHLKRNKRVPSIALCPVNMSCSAAAHRGVAMVRGVFRTAAASGMNVMRAFAHTVDPTYPLQVRCRGGQLGGGQGWVGVLALLTCRSGQRSSGAGQAGDYASLLTAQVSTSALHPQPGCPRQVR